MVEIAGSKDCGNSPKNQFAQDAAIALETGNIPGGIFDEDAIWQMPGQSEITGIAAIQSVAAKQPGIASIRIDHAISHGKIGMANGETFLSDKTIRRFCYVFEFTNTKGNRIAAIASYA